MNTSEQTIFEETNIVTHSDLFRLTNDSIQKDSSITNNKREYKKVHETEGVGGVEGGKACEHEVADEGEIEKAGEDEGQQKDAERTSFTQFNTANTASVASCGYKSINNYRRYASSHQKICSKFMQTI